MPTPIDKINEFTTAFHAGEVEKDDVELFLHEVVTPLLEENALLKIALTELVDNNLEVFKNLIKNNKIENTKIMKALKQAMDLTQDRSRMS